MLILMFWDILYVKCHEESDRWMNPNEIINLEERKSGRICSSRLEAAALICTVPNQAWIDI